MDAPYIRRGADKYNSAPHVQDTPDFISRMWRLTSERKHQPTDDAAGKTPTFQEFEASVEGRGSEATSVKELPRSMVKRLDGHLWMVLMLILHMIFRRYRQPVATDMSAAVHRQESTGMVGSQQHTHRAEGVHQQERGQQRLPEIPEKSRDQRQIPDDMLRVSEATVASTCSNSSPDGHRHVGC